MIYGSEPAVVRGMLSRTSPGPWSVFYVHPEDQDALNGEPDELEEPRLEIHDATGAIVAVLPALKGDREDASLILAALGISQDYLNTRTMLLQVDNELRQAGASLTGHRGVAEVASQAEWAREQWDGAQQETRAAVYESNTHARRVLELDGKLGEVRSLVADWGRRVMSDEARGLYRELVSVVMTSSAHTDEEDPDHGDGEAGAADEALEVYDGGPA